MSNDERLDPDTGWELSDDVRRRIVAMIDTELEAAVNRAAALGVPVGVIEQSLDSRIDRLRSVPPAMAVGPESQDVEHVGDDALDRLGVVE